MRNRVLLAGLAWASSSAGVPAQPPGEPAAQPAKPAPDLFREAEALIRDGRFDAAAVKLKQFLDAGPTDADFLALSRTDPAAFDKLLNVVTWSEDPAANAEAVKTRDAVIARARQAFQSRVKDERRVRQLARNLGGIREERVFATSELGRLGPAVLPVIIDELRNSQDAEYKAGVFETARTLPADFVPGFLTAAENLPAESRIGLLRAVVNRSDVLSLVSEAETDFSPHLWHAANAEDATVKAFAAVQLDRLSGGRAGRLKAEDELARLAEPFVNRTARFRGGDRPTLWGWDAERQTVVAVPATKPEAEEFFAVRNLRWALEKNPNCPEAQELFLTVTTERAVERAGLRDLASADPTLYRILAAAPSGTLVSLLDRALSEKRTSLAVGLSAVLALRGDRAAATSTVNRPAVLVRALDYPDFRVQFAAAQGLLRAGNTAQHGKNARIVEVLTRAAAAEPDAPGGASIGRALVADPLDVRGDKTARYLRQMGYSVERLSSGRALIRRAGRAADYDLIVIDRHIAAPTVSDTLAQLRSDVTAGGRPVVLVASGDRPAPVGVEPLLARLAALALLLPDELDARNPIKVPPPFSYDPRRAVIDEDKERADRRAVRDRELSLLLDRRLAKLQQFVAAADLPPSPALADRLTDRLPHLLLTGFVTKYGVSAESAPRTFARLQYHADILARRPVSEAALNRLPVSGLERLVETLENSLQEKAEFDQLVVGLMATVPTAGPSADELRAADALGRLAKLYPAVSVIPEPFTPGVASPAVGFGFRQEIGEATRQPANQPVAPDLRRALAKQAVGWLRALAVGENPGYDIRPAEPALRQALRDDELAPDAIDAVGKIGSAEAQQDLVNVALSLGRPLPLRVRAARAAARHVQTFGRLAGGGQAADVAKQAAAEADPELRANLLLVDQLLAGKPGDLGRLMSAYPAPLPNPPAAAPAEPKPEEKKPDEKKD